MQGDQLKRLSQQQVIVAETGVYDIPLFYAVRADIVGSASYTSLMGGSFRPVEFSSTGIKKKPIPYYRWLGTNCPEACLGMAS